MKINSISVKDFRTLRDDLYKITCQAIKDKKLISFYYEGEGSVGIPNANIRPDYNPFGDKYIPIKVGV